MKTTTSPFGRGYLSDDNLYNAQGTYVNFVVANQAPWGIPAAAVNELVAERAIYEPLYHKCQNKNTRTRADVAAHQLARKRYLKKLRSFHNRWIAHNDSIPAEQKLWLGGSLFDGEPSPSPVITDVPAIVLRSMGGGQIEVRVQRTKDATRYSMHPAANLVEYRFAIVEPGDIPPVDVEDYRKKDVSSRAKFIVKLGTKNTGKRFFALFRWVNTRRPKQEGPWTEALSVVIA